MKHITGNWTYTIGGIPSCPICGKRDKIIGIDGAYECGRCDISPTKYVANMQSRIEELEAMHDHQHLLNLADEAVAAKKRIAELEKLAVVWEKCESREQIDHSRRYCVICDRGELWICYLPAPPEEI